MKLTEWASEKLEPREILEQIRAMLSEATVEDVDIPANWPSARCSNIGHEQRPEQHGEDDWRCPDCHSTWWSVNGSPPSAGSHIEARLFALLADQSSEPRVRRVRNDDLIEKIKEVLQEHHDNHRGLDGSLRKISDIIGL